MRRIIVATFALVLVCNCGGKDASSTSTPPPDAATSDEGIENPDGGVATYPDGGVVTYPDGGIANPGPEGGPDSGAACYGSGHGPPSSPPLDHRSSATTCMRTANPETGPDAGPQSCNTDADCAGDASFSELRCVEHQCGIDQCLADADCPSDQLCVCADTVGGGTGIHVSKCVPAGCHTDADCSAGNYCVASRGTCGAVVGYNCTSSADTCVSPATDCAACGGNTCVYTPIVGHFVCATSGCNG